MQWVVLKKSMHKVKSGADKFNIITVFPEY